jgi:hypothetical protein
MTGNTPIVAPCYSPLPWVFAVVTLALALFHPAVLNDGDTLWHLTTGNWILAEHAVPVADPFSHTRAGSPWVCHEWLSDVLLALAFRAGGWSGAVCLAAAAAAAAVFQFTRYMDRWFPPMGVIVLAVAAIMLTAPSLLVRPHLLALPALTAWMIGMLEARSAARAPAWHLLPLMTLWSNLHGSYVLGLAVAGLFALEAILAAPGDWRLILRRWGGFIIAAIAAALISPNGIAGLLHPFALMGMKSLPFIIEWRPPDFSKLQPLELVLIGGMYFLLSRGIRLPPIRLLLLLVVIHLALTHARHGILVSFVALLAIAEPVAAQVIARSSQGRQQFHYGWTVAGLLIAACLVVSRLAMPIVRADGPATPISALAHVPASLKSQPVFNDYAFGGYLIHSGVHPFIDGRADMYGDAFLKAYDNTIRNDGAGLEKTLEQYGVQWTILAPGAPSAMLLNMQPGWCRLYVDDFAVIHARRTSGYCPVVTGPEASEQHSR